jgi:hypothetical protein
MMVMEPLRLPPSMLRDNPSRTYHSVGLGVLLTLALGIAYVVHFVGSAMAIR